MPRRTHTCNELRIEHVGQDVNLAGWVNSYRDHGGVIFIDLRDRTGMTQVVFHPEHATAHELADTLRNEDVISVSGQCLEREEGMANPKLDTGRIEVGDVRPLPEYRKMKFGVSEGMILASGPGGTDVFLLGVDEGAEPGERVH